MVLIYPMSAQQPPIECGLTCKIDDVDATPSPIYISYSSVSFSSAVNMYANTADHKLLKKKKSLRY